MRFAASGRMPLLRSGGALVDVHLRRQRRRRDGSGGRRDRADGIFNITNGEPIAVRDLLSRTFAALGLKVRLVESPYPILDAAARVSEAAARLLKHPEPKLLRYTLGVMAYTQTLDISAARAKLGYTPRVSIDEGLARYAAWLRAEGHGLVSPVASLARESAS